MRVVVTGLGIVSPLAPGARATMDRLCRGEVAFGPVTLFDVTGQRAGHAAEVRDLSVRDVAPRGEHEQWSRTDAMAVVAAREALGEARLDPRDAPLDLVVGGTTGGMFETEALLSEMHRDPARREPLSRMLSHPLSATADRLARTIGPFRSTRTICSACSSGANAVLLAAAAIRSGRSSRVLAGGADGLCRLTFAGFNVLGAIDPESCRPFDRRRTGLGLGEGAAFLVLEAEEAALARGATPLVEVASWAIGSEAHHITHPEREGTRAARLIQSALARGGVARSELDYVNAHGTGTPHNDAMEAAALRAALGDDIARVAVSSCKGQIGHTLGAAGAIEAAITALALVRGELPPTMGLEQPDDACRLHHVMRASRKAAAGAAISNSFGFGGSDTVLLLTRPGRFQPAAPRGRRYPVVTASATLGPLGLSGSIASAGYLEAGEGPSAPGVAFDAKEQLDLSRARRMDRATRMLTSVVAAALREASFTGPRENECVGIVGGAAYGNVDGSAEFVRTIQEKGARLASPLVFPSLVPSSPAAHASIYLGLQGPVLTTLDLGTTGESAIALAADLVEAGEADALVAASIEERSAIAERVLGPLCSGSGTWAGLRTEGASAVVIEAAESARGRNASILARVVATGTGRGEPGAPPPPAGARSYVVLARETPDATRLVLAGAWARVPRLAVAPRAGHHEALGGIAVVAAVGAIASGRADEVLVLGLSPDRWAFVVLAAP
jgi:3-oxoacyl-[acyl-carrier-protein] synthase II